MIVWHMQENEPPWNHLSPTSGTASSVVSSDWSDSENLNSRRALILKMAKARMKNRPNTELSDCNSVASLVSSVARVSGLQVSNVEVDFSKDLD